ncbi:MAG: hypothetical protein MJZ77_05645 [Bacteroidales bacterium]|nr:hypothetical protein [Bacteroidales bacterium]
MTNITGRIIAMGPVVMGTNEEGKNWFTQEVLLRGTGACADEYFACVIPDTMLAEVREKLEALPKGEKGLPMGVLDVAVRHTYKHVERDGKIRNFPRIVIYDLHPVASVQG